MNRKSIAASVQQLARERARQRVVDPAGAELGPRVEQVALDRAGVEPGESGQLAGCPAVAQQLQQCALGGDQWRLSLRRVRDDAAAQRGGFERGEDLLAR